MKLLKRTMLSILVFLLLFAPCLTLAEGDYEEGDGWEYRDGVLKISKDCGLEDFIYDEDPNTQLLKYHHTVDDVTRVVIGKNVTSLAIGQMIGSYSPSMTTIEEGNKYFQNDNGWIVNTATNTLFGAANVLESMNATIIDNLPAYIEVIGPFALSERRDMVRIDIPSGVKEIQEGAFWLCQSLQTVTLPDKLQTLGERAFSGCEALSAIEFSTYLVNVGRGAFDGCLRLSDPHIYNTRIDQMRMDCFGACFKLQTLELPETATKIEDRAFRICYALETLIINSSKITVEDLAFYSCDNLRRIIFTKGTPAYFGETLFGETGKTPEGKGYISNSSDHRGEIIPYPTLYYTEAYAAEWAPNGETEWNGYPIRQISQEELDAALAQVRGEEVPAATPAPTTAPSPTVVPAVEPFHAQEKPLLDGWMFAAIAAVVIAVGVVVVVATRSRRK